MRPAFPEHLLARSRNCAGRRASSVARAGWSWRAIWRNCSNVFESQFAAVSVLDRAAFLRLATVAVASAGMPTAPVARAAGCPHRECGRSGLCCGSGGASAGIDGHGAIRR